MSKQREIESIGNYYGYLAVKEESGKYYWSIENWDGYYWKQIPKSLYDEIVKFDDQQQSQTN